MKRIAFFIDGFNLYHAISARPDFRRYRWLDLAKLCRCFMKPSDTVAGVFYFTSYVTWDPGKLARHQLFVRAQEWNGVETVLGEFKRRDKYCPLCKRTAPSYQEKQTDINIALKLFQGAVADTYDTAIIISGDSDLIPAVKAVKTTFPAKTVGVVIPIGRTSDQFKDTAHFHMKMKRIHLDSCQLPDVIERDGVRLERPVNWR